MGVEKFSMNAMENFAIERIIISQGENGFDVSNMFRSIEIVESIDGGMIQGNIDLVESIDFVDSIGFRGEEMIHVSFFSKRPDGKAKTYTKLFRIYRYQQAESADSMNKTYVKIYFGSDAYVENELHRISKSYRSTGAHIIVKDMLKVLGYDDTLINIEETLYNKDIVIPNVTPLEAIAHLTNCVQSGVSNNKADSNFYFFENRDKVNFVSGMSLTQKEPVSTIIYEASGNISMLDRAIRFVRDRGYNLQDQLRNGGLGSTVNSHSLVNKRYRSVYTDDVSVKEIYPRLNTDPWYGGELVSNRDACIELRPEDQMYKFLNSGSNGNASAIRSINRTGLNAHRAFMIIPGNTNITVGDIINLDVRKNTKSGSTSNDSGKWLISKLTHRITKEIYQMSLEIITDSNLRRL